MNGYVKVIISENFLSQNSENFIRLLQHHQQKLIAQIIRTFIFQT